MNKSNLYKISIACFLVAIAIMLTGIPFENQLKESGYDIIFVISGISLVIVALLLRLCDIIIKHRSTRIRHTVIEEYFGVAKEKRAIGNKKIQKAIKNFFLFLALLIVSVTVVARFRGYYSDSFENLIIGLALASLIVYIWRKIAQTPNNNA